MKTKEAIRREYKCLIAMLKDKIEKDLAFYNSRKQERQDEIDDLIEKGFLPNELLIQAVKEYSAKAEVCEDILDYIDKHI